MATRRDFMKLTAMASAACGLSSCGTTGSITAPITKAGKVFAQSPILRKFISPLPALGTGIPIASADTSTVPGVDLYNLSAVQYHQLMHPDLPNPTTLWGYMDQSTGKSAYLGPIIVAQRGRPSMIRATNMLPSKHPLPVDTTLMGADNGAAQNRMTIHLHGGLTPWTSDGGPFSWFTPTATGPPLAPENASSTESPEPRAQPNTTIPTT
jgi:spore coat protein A